MRWCISSFFKSIMSPCGPDSLGQVSWKSWSTADTPRDGRSATEASTLVLLRATFNIGRGSEETLRMKSSPSSEEG